MPLQNALQQALHGARPAAAASDYMPSRPMIVSAFAEGPSREGSAEVGRPQQNLAPAVQERSDVPQTDVSIRGGVLHNLQPFQGPQSSQHTALVSVEHSSLFCLNIAFYVTRDTSTVHSCARKHKGNANRVDEVSAQEFLPLAKAKTGQSTCRQLSTQAPRLRNTNVANPLFIGQPHCRAPEASDAGFH